MEGRGEVQGENPDPSKELEDTIDRDAPYNDGAILAQQLENYCHNSGVHVWGLVIYRCTYASEAKWQAFMNILNERARSSLRIHSTPEILERLDWTVQSDPVALNNASRDDIRARFRQWVAQQTTTLREPDDLNTTWTQRFRYCIYVDAAALESVMRGAPQSPDQDLDGVGYVDLIFKDWDEQNAREEDDGEEELDGYRTNEVGWMRAAVNGLVPQTYMLLGEAPLSEVYERPPTVVKP